MGSEVTKAAVAVSAPGSSGNLGPGFDVLGLALEIRNEARVVAKRPGRGALTLAVTGEGSEELQGGGAQEGNLLVTALRRGLSSVGLDDVDLQIEQRNGIPLRRGLGSSAAAAVVGAAAGLALAEKLSGRDHPPSTEQVLAATLPLEGHADNLVPSLVGGLCICWYAGDEVRWHRIPVPQGLDAVLCIPAFEIATSDAREVLPATLPRDDAVFSVGRASLLVAALLEGRLDLLAEAMEDRIHQGHRIGLLPPMGHAIEAAQGAGAKGACVSGSGSTVLALCDSRTPKVTDAVGSAMVEAFSASGIAARSMTTRFSAEGMKVEEIEDHDQGCFLKRGEK